MHDLASYVPRYYVVKGSRHKNDLQWIFDSDQALIDIVDNGLSTSQSAKKWNRRTSTMTYMLQRCVDSHKIVVSSNWTTNHNRPANHIEWVNNKWRLSETAVKTLRAMYASGCTYRQIIAFGYSGRSIRKYCLKDKDLRIDRADPTEDYGLPHA